MKFRTKQLIRAAGMVLVGIFVASTASAQASDVDASPSFPQVMTVERVNMSDNTVVLDGNLYRLPEAPKDGDSTAASASQAEQSRVPFIGKLEPGMRVQVVTDGSLPSANHAPNILELELE